MSHAVSKSRWSDQVGFSFFSTSQIALCSLVNRVCSADSPNHQFSLKPVRSRPGTFGSGSRRPLSPILILPSVNVRSSSWVFWSDP